MRVLIFGTVHADNQEKFDLTRMWSSLHRTINPRCDMLLVDTNTLTRDAVNGRTEIFSFGNNVGHLARGGQDGWGRAFSKGLEIAVTREYDYVAHVEGDSLCRVDVLSYCTEMSRTGVKCAGVPVVGTRRNEMNWLETGLMFFSVDYIRSTRLIERYDWTRGENKKYPHTPEWHLQRLTRGVLQVAGLRNMRDDMNVLNENIVTEYDWITHARKNILDSFYKFNLERIS